ncbi:MAG: rhomboid family intramembrane serine protease [Fimbriimonadaceae bacterium]
MANGNPQPQAKPWVTISCLLLCIGTAYYLLIQPQILFDFGFRADRPTILTALTSLFLHQNVLHLLGNMLFLAAVGAAVEAATGWWRFAFVYFGGGLIGVAAHWLFSIKAGSAPPLIGASGCVAACIAYYGVRYFRMQVALAPKVGASVLTLTAVWFALQILGVFFTLPGTVGTAFWAHLGGFVGGIALSLLFKAPKDGERQLGHAVVDQMDQRSPAAKLVATDLHLAEHPDDVQALFKKVDALATLGDKDQEGAVLLQMLSKLPEVDRPPILGRLIGIGQVGRLPSLQRTLLAEKYRQTNPGLAKSLLLSVIGGDRKDSQRPEALLAISALSPNEAEPYLEELKENFPLHPATDLARTRGLI